MALLDMKPHVGGTLSRVAVGGYFYQYCLDRFWLSHVLNDRSRLKAIVWDVLRGSHCENEG